MPQLIIPNEQRLVTAALTLIGSERLMQYNSNNFPIDLIIKFFQGKIAEPRLYYGVLCNLIGMEGNKDLTQYLRRIGAKNIQCEVEIETYLGKTSIDAVAEINHNIETFEAKFVKRVNKRVIPQIKKARGYYKDAKTNLYLAKDTKVPKFIVKELKGTEIIRSEKRRDDIIEDILSVQKRICVLH